LQQAKNQANQGPAQESLLHFAQQITYNVFARVVERDGGEWDYGTYV
jgi:hypothetical protein